MKIRNSTGKHVSVPPILLRNDIELFSDFVYMLKYLQQMKEQKIRTKTRQNSQPMCALVMLFVL